MFLRLCNRFINKRDNRVQKGEDAESRVGVPWIPLNGLELVGETRGGFWKSLAGCRPRVTHGFSLTVTVTRVIKHFDPSPWNRPLYELFNGAPLVGDFQMSPGAKSKIVFFFLLQPFFFFFFNQILLNIECALL